MSSASINNVYDARGHAAAVVRMLTRSESNNPILCYGTPEKLTIGVGFVDRIEISGTKWIRESCHGDRREGVVADQFSDELERFIHEHRTDVVMGQLGFEINQIYSSDLAVSEVPSSVVFVPEHILQVHSDGTMATISGSEMSGLDNVEAIRVQPVSVASPPLSVLNDYGRKVVQAKKWVCQQPRTRRVTVCTSYDPCQSVDFAATIGAGHIDEKGLSRVFFLRTGPLFISGTSPELLVQYRPGHLLTHKLSGTFRGTEIETVPDNRERVEAEHSLSVKAMLSQLNRLGAASQGRRFTLTVGSLSHFATTFKTNMDIDNNLATVLLTLLPSGAAPITEGLDLIGSLEKEPRGAYYGLIGICYPDGSAEWSQLLRGVFENGADSRVFVGSAVTSLSTAEIEQDEIVLKIANIRVALNGDR